MGESKIVSVLIPSVVASMLTFLMYIGGMILLNGHLYSFGTGVIFRSIPGIVLAPIDLIIIIASGGITGLIFLWINGFRTDSKEG